MTTTAGYASIIIEACACGALRETGLTELANNYVGQGRATIYTNLVF